MNTQRSFVLAFDTANEVIAIGLGKLDAATQSIECVASVEVEARRASNTQLLPRIDELCAQAIAIAEGSCGAAETAAGAFVLLRQPLEESAAAGAFFDEALSRAASEAEITYADTWDTIDAASYYEKVTALREKL